MSRIPVRTPSRSSSRTGQHPGALDLEDSTLFQTAPKAPSNKFKTPSKPISTRSTTMAKSTNGHTLGRSTSTAGRPENTPQQSVTRKSVTSRTDTVVPTSQPAKMGDLRSAKSSAGLREHIAKARAELQKSAKKTPSTTRRVATLNLGDVDDANAIDDPFSTIKDPFNQAKFLPKSDPSLDRAIKKAREDGRLNIANMQLDKIPSAVYNMYKPDPSHVIDFSMDAGSAWYEYIDLTYLNAADNELIKIEDEFVDIFGGIESIDLHNNQLGHLPECFLQLSILTSLNLAGNNIDETSFNLLCQIETMTELNLSRNRLVGPLSSKLSNLQHLISLDVSENEVDAIDDAMTGCRKLQKINLAGNKIERLSISQLSNQTRLIELDASRNKIETPFVDMSHTFPHLERLNLAHNSITQIATSDEYTLTLPVLDTLLLLQNSLSNLEGLRTPALVNLNLEGNAFSVLPNHLFDLSQLRHLDISDNKLTQLDYRLGCLELTQFRWEGNLVRMRSCFGLSTSEMLKHLRHLGPMQNPEQTISDNDDDGARI